MNIGIGEPPRLADLDLLVFDFDGVLTDNRVYVFADGTESVACTRADGWGLDLLRKTPLKMAIISTETNPVVAARAKKLRLPVLQGIGDKREALTRLAAEYGVTLARTGFVGNDTNDLPALESAGWPICPSDAHKHVRAMARWILPCRGGAGVVRHLADALLIDDAAKRQSTVANSSSRRFQTLSRRVVFQAEPYVSIAREHVRLPDGRELPDYYLVKQPNYVVVVPVAMDGRLVMLREYKHGAGRSVLAFPGGNINGGEEALRAAARELAEETGYGGGDWKPLGHFVCHGSQGCGEAHFFLAQGVHPVREPDPDEPERESILLIDRSEVTEALHRGEIAVLGHAAAFALALAAGLGR